MPASPSDAIKEKVMEKEGDKILKYVGADDYVILLDTSGKELSFRRCRSCCRNR